MPVAVVDEARVGRHRRRDVVGDVRACVRNRDQQRHRALLQREYSRLFSHVAVTVEVRAAHAGACAGSRASAQQLRQVRRGSPHRQPRRRGGGGRSPRARRPYRRRAPAYRVFGEHRARQPRGAVVFGNRRMIGIEHEPVGAAAVAQRADRPPARLRAARERGVEQIDRPRMRASRSPARCAHDARAAARIRAGAAPRASRPMHGCPNRFDRAALREIVDRRKDAVAEVRFGRQAQAGYGTALCECSRLRGVDVRRMHEAPGARRRPKRSSSHCTGRAPVRAHAVVDFGRLLGNVDVHGCVVGQGRRAARATRSPTPRAASAARRRSAVRHAREPCGASRRAVRAGRPAC